MAPLARMLLLAVGVTSVGLIALASFRTSSDLDERTDRTNRSASDSLMPSGAVVGAHLGDDSTERVDEGSSEREPALPPAASGSAAGNPLLPKVQRPARDPLFHFGLDSEGIDAWARKNVASVPWSVVEIPGNYGEGDVSVVADIESGSELLRDKECALVRLSATSVVVLVPTGARTVEGTMRLTLRADGVLKDVIQMKISPDPLTSARAKRLVDGLMLHPSASPVGRACTEDPKRCKEAVEKVASLLRTQFAVESGANAFEKRERQDALEYLKLIEGRAIERAAREGPH